jgi:HlyD family secretion protein
VEEQRVNVIVRLGELPDVPLPLGDGFRVGVRIVIWDQPDVMQIPTSSVFRVGSRWATFVVTDGRLVTRPITIGARGDRAVHILNGVSAGEFVVLYPGDSLTAGARVIMR